MGRTYIRGNSGEDKHSKKGSKKKHKHKSPHLVGVRYDSFEREELEDLFQEDCPTLEKFDQSNEKRNRP